MHALWWCPAASDVWAEEGSHVQKWRVGVKDVFQLWDEMFCKLTTENVKKMVIMLINIWHRRNKAIFDKQVLGPATVMQMSLVGYENFKLAQRRLEGEIEQKKVNVGSGKGKGWKKPVGLQLKANFDAALSVTSLSMGIGVVIRDCNGDVFTAKCAKRSYSCHAFVAECTALWEAMVLCEDLGLRGVVFKGDAKCVIDAVKKYEMDDSKFGHLVEGLQQKLKMYNRWEVGFVHREGNEVAHQLTKMAMFRDDDVYWIEEGPELVSNQLLIDKMYTDTDRS